MEDTYSELAMPSSSSGAKQNRMSPEDMYSLPHLQKLVDRHLRTLVPATHLEPHSLHAALSYSLLAPGKRLRPLLTMLTYFHFGRSDLAALDVACAIEMVHAASLVIDDLPAMDDSNLRRGQPTAHRKFGEDIAILSGIALLNQAYAVVANSPGLRSETQIDLMRLLCGAVGSEGLIGGQVMDLKLRGDAVEDQQLLKLNELKTSALFVAAAEAGARIADASAEELMHVRKFAMDLGAAFQIADDLMDDPSFAGKTGKDTGKDATKPTLASRCGRDEAIALRDKYLLSAKQHLCAFGDRDGPLARLLDFSFEKAST